MVVWIEAVYSVVLRYDLLEGVFCGELVQQELVSAKLCLPPPPPRLRQLGLEDGPGHRVELRDWLAVDDATGGLPGVC